MKLPCLKATPRFYVEACQGWKFKKALGLSRKRHQIERVPDHGCFQGGKMAFMKEKNASQIQSPGKCTLEIWR